MFYSSNTYCPGWAVLQIAQGCQGRIYVMQHRAKNRQKMLARFSGYNAARGSCQKPQSQSFFYTAHYLA
ncbi:hypothetical protein ECZU51_19540 [Escherichia coli]|nr:hypothetical protein ECZU51_19540 [Escherichia coli]